MSSSSPASLVATMSLPEADGVTPTCTSLPLPVGLVLAGDVARFGVSEVPSDGRARFGTSDVTAGTTEDAVGRDSDGTGTPPSNEEGVAVVGKLTGDVKEPRGMTPRPLGTSEDTSGNWAAGTANSGSAMAASGISGNAAGTDAASPVALDVPGEALTPPEGTSDPALDAALLTGSPPRPPPAARSPCWRRG